MRTVRLIDLALELVPVSFEARVQLEKRHDVTADEASAAFGVTGLVLERFARAPTQAAAAAMLLELVDPELVAAAAADVVREYKPPGATAEGAAELVRDAARRILRGEVKFPEDPMHALVTRIGVGPRARS